MALSQKAINITGESEDKKTTIDTLFNALQTVAQNPNILTDPDVVSPLEIQTAAAQPQPQAGPGQQTQPQQPQGNYPGNAPQGATSPIIYAQVRYTNAEVEQLKSIFPDVDSLKLYRKYLLDHPLTHDEIDRVQALWAPASVRAIIIKTTLPVCVPKT
jgi:hypothetical protein